MQGEAPRLLTWANGLTSLRLIAAPGLALALLDTGRVAPFVAFSLFWGAVATDLLDGRVARRLGQTSAFGGFLDHLTDATFVTVGAFALALRGEAPLLLPPLIALAFAQYTLDSRTLAGRPLRASTLGRWNGIAYFVLLGIPVCRDALGISWPRNGLLLALGWLLIASTIASMSDRLLALRR
jgi:phosphatidylglycerophosphate synthase